MTKKAWRLIFAPGLLQNYLSGEPVWTFRKYSETSHEFTKGQIIEGHFMDGLMLQLEVVEDTRIKPFLHISPEERRAWGATSLREMMEQMKKHYPDLKLEDNAALICTRLARINGVPIAGFLPEDLR